MAGKIAKKPTVMRANERQEEYVVRFILWLRGHDSPFARRPPWPRAAKTGRLSRSVQTACACAAGLEMGGKDQAFTGGPIKIREGWYSLGLGMRAHPPMRSTRS